MNIDQVARLAEALTGGDAGAIEDALEKAWQLQRDAD